MTLPGFLSFEMVATRKLLTNIEEEKVLHHAEKLCAEVGISLEYDDCLHVGISRHRSIEVDIYKLCSNLKKKAVPLIFSGLERRFCEKNLEILSSLDSTDASKENYFDYKSALPVINHFENCINVELMSLKTEISRDKIIVLEEKNSFLSFIQAH